jgi:nitrogen fixation protein FixH
MFFTSDRSSVIVDIVVFFGFLILLVIVMMILARNDLSPGAKQRSRYVTSAMTFFKGSR